MSRKKAKSIYRRINIFITCISIICILMMGYHVIAAEKNSVEYSYANEEKTQVEATSYVPSDYAETYEDHLSMGETLTVGGKMYPIVGIAPGTFANTKLCSVLIKERDTAFFIDQKAFQNVSVLNPLAYEGAGSITVSCDVDTIGAYAFSNAVVSNNICFEGDVGEMGAYAFEEVQVPGSFSFKGNIDTIGDYAFKNAGVVVVHKFRKAGTGAFYGTDIGELNAIDGMEILGDNAFENCTSLKTVKLADSVTTIGDNCFKGCTSLTSVTLPFSDTLTIGENAFPNQEGLKIIIPSEVTEINNYNFNTLTNVVFQIDVDCSTTVTQYFEENGLQYQKGEDGEVIKGDGEGSSNDDEGDSSDDKENSEDNGASDSNDTDNDGTASGGTGVDGNHSDAPEGTTSPETPSTDTSKSQVPQKGKTYTYKNMCYKVTGSKTVTFMKPVNKNVKKITIPSKVKILGKTFKVTKINKKACYGCKKLTTVTIGDNVTVIGNQSFAKCKKLKTVIVGKNVTTIEKQAFANDKALRKFKIRSTKLKTVKKGVFKGLSTKKVKIRVTTKKAQKQCSKLFTKKSVWK